MRAESDGFGDVIDACEVDGRKGGSVSGQAGLRRMNPSCASCGQECLSQRGHGCGWRGGVAATTGAKGAQSQERGGGFFLVITAMRCGFVCVGMKQGRRRNEIGTRHSVQLLSEQGRAQDGEYQTG